MPANPRIQLRTAILVVLSVAAWLLLPVTATAHSYLNSSNPADGAVLAHAPQVVTLRFSDGVRKQGLGVTAQGPEGTISLPAAAASKKVTAIWPTDTPPGNYSVAYRAVSVDGHVMRGQISFQIAGPKAASADEGTPPTSPTPTSGSVGAQNSQNTAAGQQAPGSVPIWLLAAGAAIGIVGVLMVVILRKRGSR